MTRHAMQRLFCGIVISLAAAAAHVHAQVRPTPAVVFVDLLPAVRNGTTIADWQRTHPEDTIEWAPATLSDRPAQRTPFNCARVTRSRDTVQGAASINVYFFLPSTDDTAPPFGAGEDAVRRACRVGLVTVVVNAPDWSPEDERTAIGALGTPQRGVRVFLEGLPFGSTRTLYWQTVPFAAFMNTRAQSLAERGSNSQVVFVAAHDRAQMKLSIFTDRRPGVLRESVRWAASQAQWAERLTEAVGLSGQPTARQQVALSLVSRFAANTASPPPITGAEARQLSELIVAWVDAAKTMPPAPRAASLIAADGLLDLSPAWWGGEDKGAVRAPLEARGASFRRAPLGGGDFINRQGWLRQAAAMSPGGRVEELLLLQQMTRGFEFDLCSDQGGFGFRAVIKNATTYLAAHPDSAIAGDVQLLLGDAWADIVALAAGSGGDYVEAKKFVPEAAVARASALAAYRAGWSSASAARRQISSETAWALLAGLTPAYTTFLCIYD